MKVLSISTDRKIFDDKSAVFLRSLDYSSKMKELHIIVFSPKKYKLMSKSIGNLHIYSTNSLTRLNYVFDALSIGKKIILKNRFILGDSVISTQDPFETGLVGYFLKKRFNFPIQLQIHTDFLSLYFKNSFLNYVRVFIANFLIPKAQGLRVVSSLISDSISSHFPELKIKPEILPVFIDIEKIINQVPKLDIKANLPQFKFIIFMASRLAKEKRIDVAMSTFQRVVNEFPYAGLVIAGMGPEKEHLENLVKKLGLSNSVSFIGWQEDLVSIYKTADIFLLTSEYEGYGMTLIEAGASGLPIVTTNVGLAKTSLFKNGDNSFICPVGNVDSLTKALTDLIKDSDKRRLFKEKMMDSIKSVAISRDDYVVRYVSLLQKLI